MERQRRFRALYEYDAINGWMKYASHAAICADREFIVLEFPDGGRGDTEGSACGIIADPSAPVDSQACLP